MSVVRASHARKRRGHFVKNLVSMCGKWLSLGVLGVSLMWSLWAEFSMFSGLVPFGGSRERHFLAFLGFEVPTFLACGPSASLLPSHLPLHF